MDNQNNGTGKTILIVILLLLVLGLTGYIVYDKVITTETNNEVKEESSITPEPEKTAISGSYVYEGAYEPTPELTLHLELKLNEDNTFILYNSINYAAAYKGTYTLNGSKLTLYAIEADHFQSENSRDIVSSDTVECTYDETNNIVNINKWYYHWYNDETKKVEHNTETYSSVKLTQTKTLENIDNGELFGN